MRPPIPLLLLLTFAANAWATGEGSEPSFYERYRADLVPAVAGGAIAELDLLRPNGARAWPRALEVAVRERVRTDWRTDRTYGPLLARVPVWLEYPLVTARVGDRVLVPVVADEALDIRGHFDLPPAGSPRRIVILIDASQSSNARTRFEHADGTTTELSVIEAERLALEHLLSRVDDPGLELGLIAFGETAWPVAEPGRSPDALFRALAEFREERPRGEGRTDLVCALWTAWDWLKDTPDGTGREIVVLTDGDLPNSGRLDSCELKRTPYTRMACESRRNRTVCPASHTLRRSDGGSSLKQLQKLAHRLRKKVTISPLVFEADRSARAYRELAETTGGEFTQVPSAQAIERALPPLVAGVVDGVFARNLHTGATTHDLRSDGVGQFAGRLPLRPGANDVELWIESGGEPASRFRFRVHSAATQLEQFLAAVRERNRTLERRDAELLEGTRALLPGRSRAIEVATESD